MSVRPITANARTTANLNPRLSGSCAIFPLVAMTEIAMPDFRGRNQERSVNYFTLDVRRFIALRTSIASPARGAVAEPVSLPIASRYWLKPYRT